MNDIPAVRSEAVRWWLLISQMERVRAERHLGQATGWQHVHAGDLAKAERVFLQMCAVIGFDPGPIGPGHGDHEPTSRCPECVAERQAHRKVVAKARNEQFSSRQGGRP